jgi:hypothetical protein
MSKVHLASSLLARPGLRRNLELARCAVECTDRRRFLVGALGTVALGRPALTSAAPSPVLVEVWKSPTCGCCQGWVEHMQANGFRVRVHDTGNTTMRGRMKVPEKLGSCHTAVIGRYALEGHVPAQDVRRLLKDRPEAIGLAVPGMPVGSPGMDGPDYGGRRDAYDVLLIGLDGSTRVFSSHR